MFRIFMKMKEQYIKTEMEYPFNFWMMMIAGVVTRIVGIAVPFVIYSNIPSIGGWEKEEIYVIMAFLYIADGLCSILFEGIWMLPEMVFHGQFDMILSRPVSPLFQVLANGMGLQGIANAISGIMIMIVSLDALNKLTMFHILLSLLFIICGTVILMSVSLIGNSIIFWFDSGGRSSVAYAMLNVGNFAKYPTVIYPKVIRFILLFIIPFTFIGEIPAKVIMGKSNYFSIIAIIGISILFFVFARFVFYKGISKYESVGM